VDTFVVFLSTVRVLHIDTIFCLCRHFVDFRRHFCSIEMMIDEPDQFLSTVRDTIFCLCRHFVDFRRHFCSIEMMIDEPDPQTSLPIM